MLINRFQQIIRSKHLICRQKWTDSRVSACETYHIRLDTQQPLYHRQFKTVLPFHSPGLAPVIDQSGAAFHINDRGENAYSQHFHRTFGFYQNLATVQVCDLIKQYIYKINSNVLRKLIIGIILLHKGPQHINLSGNGVVIFNRIDVLYEILSLDIIILIR
jgi:hypothetical protein